MFPPPSFSILLSISLYTYKRNKSNHNPKMNIISSARKTWLIKPIKTKDGYNKLEIDTISNQLCKYSHRFWKDNFIHPCSLRSLFWSPQTKSWRIQNVERWCDSWKVCIIIIYNQGKNIWNFRENPWNFGATSVLLSSVMSLRMRRSFNGRVLT